MTLSNHPAYHTTAIITAVELFLVNNKAAKIGRQASMRQFPARGSLIALASTAGPPCPSLATLRAQGATAHTAAPRPARGEEIDCSKG